MYESSLDASDSVALALVVVVAVIRRVGAFEEGRQARRWSRRARRGRFGPGRRTWRRTWRRRSPWIPSPTVPARAHARGGVPSESAEDSGEGEESGRPFRAATRGSMGGAEGEGAPLHARGELSVVLTVAAAAAAAPSSSSSLTRLGRGGRDLITSVWRGSRAGGLGCSLVGASRLVETTRGVGSRRRARTRLRMAWDVGTRDWVATRTWTHGADARRHAGGTSSPSTRRSAAGAAVACFRDGPPLDTVAAGVELAERREHGHA